MTKEKKLICVLAGMIAGIILSVILISNGIVSAKSIREKNADAAFWIMAKNYDEYKIEPVTGLAILHGESRAMTAAANHGRPYGMVGHRYYDIESATVAFLELIRYNRWYKNAWKHKNWQDELAAIQSCGYCQDGSDYLSYLHSIIRTYNLEKYETKFKKYRKKIKQKRKQRRLDELRKARQKRPFVLVYDPTLAPWQIKTDPEFIKGGTVQIGWTWCEVVETKEGIGYTIRTGDRTAMIARQTMLGDVIENAVG